MTKSRHEPDSLPTDNPEVRSYIKRLLAVMALGIALMTVTAVWAWNKYSRVSEAPPLPAGAPPLSSVPATTR